MLGGNPFPKGWLFTGAAMPSVGKVVDGEEILRLRKLVRDVPVASHVQDYASRLVLATHPDSEHALENVKKYVRYGASPRGAQSLILSGKVKALLDGRFNVSFKDISESAHSSLRHRILTTFEAQAEGVSPDQIIDDVLESQKELAAAGG